MSVSLYWTAYRDRPLSSAEEIRAEAIVEAAGTDPRVVALVGAEGTFWEGLIPWSDPEEESDVIRGSSTLPRLSAPVLKALLEHSCQALAGLRGAVEGAEWDVALDHIPVPWDPTGRYVIGSEHLEHYGKSMEWEAGLA